MNRLTSSVASRYVLFDTDVLSYRFSGRENFIAPFRPYWVGKIAYISFVTLSEAREGAILAGWSEATRMELESYLRTYVPIPADHKLTKTWVKLRQLCKSRGIALTENDAWVAATAWQYEIPLLSNDRDFRHIPEITVYPPEAVDTPQGGPGPPFRSREKGRRITAGIDLTKLP